MSSVVALFSCALLLSAGAAFAAVDTQSLGNDSTCVTCHELEEDEELVLPVAEWRESVHAVHAVSCDACHGGDPHEEDADLSMSEEAGFVDNPSWREMADYCGVCHEAIGESWTLGFLGARMREGVRVPTCATCHMPDGHRIDESTADDLLTEERCSSCEPVEDVEALRKQSFDLDEFATRVGAAVDTVEAKGINAMPLYRDIGAARIGWVTTLHRFDPDLNEPAGREARSMLGEIELRAQEQEGEADLRRGYGTALVAVLSCLFATLLWIRSRLS